MINKPFNETETLKERVSRQKEQITELQCYISELKKRIEETKKSAYEEFAEKLINSSYIIIFENKSEVKAVINAENVLKTLKEVGGGKSD